MVPPFAMARKQPQQRCTLLDKLPKRQRRARFQCGKECPLLFFLGFCSLYGTVLWIHHQQVVVHTVEQQVSTINQRSSVRHTPPISAEKSFVTVESPNITDSKYAYAFLLGGAMSTKPGSDHRGGLYSVVAAAHNLRRHNSTADIVLMVQISTMSNATRLPEQQEQVLRRLNIRFLYLPKYSDPKFEKFYNLMMEKFRILSLTEYERVTYLDFDVLPKCNLDYVMELSVQGVLMDNVILANKIEPASGGFFVLSPSPNDYMRLQNIIMNVENRSMYMKYPHWDKTDGWGHHILQEKNDYWVTSKGEKGYSWDWYGVQADQGLLYFWTKYVLKSVSIIISQSVEHWGAYGADVIQESIVDNLLKRYSCSNGPLKKAAPYRDFVHLTGRKKPWHSNLTTLEQGLNSKTMEAFTAQELWLWLLKDALRSIGMENIVPLDFIKGEVENAALGTTPGNRQRNMLIKNKAKAKWEQYQQKVHN
jgi:hypothetical protein